MKKVLFALLGALAACRPSDARHQLMTSNEFLFPPPDVGTNEIGDDCMLRTLVVAGINGSEFFHADAQDSQCGGPWRPLDSVAGATGDVGPGAHPDRLHLRELLQVVWTGRLLGSRNERYATHHMGAGVANGLHHLG